MTAQVSDPVGTLLGDLVEGRGRAITLPRDADPVALVGAARASGVVVADVPVEPALRAFALGALISGFRAAGTAPELPPVGAAGTPPRVAAHLSRLLQEYLSELDAPTGVLVVVHGRDSLDPVSEGWLQAATGWSDDLPALSVVTVDEDIAADTPPPDAELDGLDGTQHLLAALLAVSDCALTVPELAEVSGHTAVHCTRVMGALVDRGIVAAHADHFVLRATPQRELLRSDLPTSLRRAVERGLLAAVRHRVPAALLAERAMASVRPEDPVAIEILVEAMHALADSDPDAAADYGTAAVACFHEPDDRLTAIVWRLLPLLWQTARVDEARALARRVFAERGRPEAEAQVLLWLARFEGSARRAVALTETALTIPGVPAPIRARLHSVHLRGLTTLGRVAEVDEILPGALAEAHESGNDEALSRLQTWDAIRHFYRGEYGRSAELTALAEATWHRSGAPQAERMPEVIWSPHLTAVLGDAVAGLQRIDDLLAEPAVGAQVSTARFLHGERAFALLLLGHLDGAKDAAVLATTLSQDLWREPEVEDRLQATAFSVRLKVALHQGDPADLAELRRVCESIEAEPGTEAWARRGWWRFLLDEAQGRSGPHRRTVDPATLPPPPWHDPADAVLLCRALLMQDHRRPALALIEEAARFARDDAHPLAVAVASHLQGLGNVDESALERARDGWRGLARPLTEAAALSDLGAIRMDSGDSAGLPLIEEAHARFVELGAARDAWRIRWFLRVRGHGVEPARTASPALTPTERRVVDRAARGGSVRRIAEDLALSPHTVTSHLRHVYLKLGVRSRIELEEWVRAR